MAVHMGITECGDTACGFDSGLMALLSLHLSSVSSPLSVMHTNFYFKWVFCLFKCHNIKACHQPLEMPAKMDVDSFRTQTVRIERVLGVCVCVCMCVF